MIHVNPAYNLLYIETMTTPKENKWKPRFPRRYNKRNRVIISREEIKKALDIYFKNGGKVIKLTVDERLMQDIPVHFEDSYYG